MKKIFILSALLVLLYSSAFSQDPEMEYYKSKEIKTLLGRNRSGGGYGAFTVGYSDIDSKQALLFGGRFGWITGQALAIGIGATYRFPTAFDVGLSGTTTASAESLKGLSYMVTFKFGKF